MLAENFTDHMIWRPKYPNITTEDDLLLLDTIASLPANRLPVIMKFYAASIVVWFKIK